MPQKKKVEKDELEILAPEGIEIKLGNKRVNVKAVAFAKIKQFLRQDNKNFATLMQLKDKEVADPEVIKQVDAMLDNANKSLPLVIDGITSADVDNATYPQIMAAFEAVIEENQLKNLISLADSQGRMQYLGGK